MKNGVFWDVTPFLQEPHCVTSQKTPFFFLEGVPGDVKENYTERVLSEQYGMPICGMRSSGS
jgi:hypothetical protein